MLSSRLTTIAAEVHALFQELDLETAQFASRSGLSCVKLCGACCQSPHIEASIAEMLPLALTLARAGRLDETHEQLVTNPGTQCLQYQPPSSTAERGSCLNYQNRPGLCRLFGFAASMDKSGRASYVACRPICQQQHARLQKVQASIANGELKVPRFARMRQRLADIAGSLGLEVLPINEALRLALEMVSLDMQLQTQADLSQVSA